jgi:hypothetical protein
MSWLGRLHQARIDLAKHGPDSWRRKLEAAVRGKNAISTVVLCDLLRVPANTGSARRIAKHMKSMGFIPLKSRRLLPGGWRDTVARGWARPLHETKTPTTKPGAAGKQGAKVEDRATTL